MANVLDLGLLSGFSVIFSFVLVFAIVYALLAYTKFLGETKSLHAGIAFSISVIMLFTPKAMKVVETMVPWFVLVIIAGALILMIYKLFGAPDEGIEYAVVNYGGVKYGILAISIVIIVMSSANVYFDDGSGNGNKTLSDSYNGDVGGTGQDALMATLFHPKVLGLEVMLLIGTFTIALLSQTRRKFY